MHGHNNNVRKEGRKERKKERKKERRGRLKKMTSMKVEALRR